MSEQKRDNLGGPRIVLSYEEPPSWRCLLCGGAVFHVDDHYDWHVQVDAILAVTVFGELET